MVQSSWRWCHQVSHIIHVILRCPFRIEVVTSHCLKKLEHRIAYHGINYDGTNAFVKAKNSLGSVYRVGTVQEAIVACINWHDATSSVRVIDDGSSSLHNQSVHNGLERIERHDGAKLTGQASYGCRIGQDNDFLFIFILRKQSFLKMTKAQVYLMWKRI